MPLERKKTLNVFKEAKEAWGSYDDYPVGPRGTDPMPHLSRNRVAQPFFVVCEKDQVLIQMAGEGVLEMRETDVTQMRLSPGDTVYVPAGVPSRVVPRRREPPGPPQGRAAGARGGRVVLRGLRRAGAHARARRGGPPAAVLGRRAGVQRGRGAPHVRRVRRGSPAGRPRRHRVARGGRGAPRSAMKAGEGAAAGAVSAASRRSARATAARKRRPARARRGRPRP